MSSLKKKATKGVLWSAVDRFSAQGVQFIIGIIVARLLLPSDYGLIGMLAIFLSISETFIQSGFGAALIQKKNRDELDFSTTFYFNIVVAAVFYILMYFTSPLIANFYKQPLLIPLTRVLGLTIVFNSFAVIQRTKYSIILDFKTQTKASLSSMALSGCLGIYLAYTGFGVWAIVWQSIFRALVNTVVLWYYGQWIPKEGFSYLRFKKLFSFGSKLLASSLIDTFYRNIYLIVIGKLFSTTQLGYYTRAQQFNKFPSQNIQAILGRVTFPLLSKLQDNNAQLITAYRKLITLSALLVFPLMIGMAAVADPLIRLLLTDKWIETVWILQLLCFGGMWYPVHALNLSILNVKGRSDFFLRLEIIKKVMVTIVLLISIPLGLKTMIIGQVLTSYMALAINCYYTKQIIGYGFLQQMQDLLMVLLLSFAMGILIYFTLLLIDNNVLKLVIGILEGVIFYTGMAWIFNIGEIRFLPTLLQTK